MAELVYQAAQSVVLDASGNGTITFAGAPSYYRRRLTSVVITTTSATPRPTCRVYRSSVAAGRLMATSRTGDADTLIADAGDVLSSGEPLIVVWSGGPPGATANANVNGYDVRDA